MEKSYAIHTGNTKRNRLINFIFRQYGLKNIERFFFAFYIIIIKVLRSIFLERHSYKQLNNLEKQYEIDSL